MSNEPKGKMEKVEDPETEARKRKEQREQEKKQEQKAYEEKMKEKDEEMKRKQMVKPYELPLWIRLGNIVFGALFIGLSFFALANENLTVANAIIVLGVILLLSGLSRFVNAFYDKEIGGTKRLTRFFISIILIGLAVVTIVFQGVGEDVLFLLLALGLVFQGLARFVSSVRHPAFPFWLKFTQIGFGIASAVLGVAAMIPSISPDSIDIDVLLLLVIGFFISGISRVSLGLVGIGQKKQEEK